MARKRKNDVQKIREQIGKLLPKGMVPDSYIEYLVIDNKEICDSEVELIADVKMQLFEETGCDLPLTRAEAQAYLFDEIDDAGWERMSKDGVISSSQVKLLEDSNDKTMLELIREMPLIPASRIIGSIVVSYLRGNGMDVDAEQEEKIVEDLIHSLNMSFSEMAMGGMEFDPDEALDDLFDLPFDWDGRDQDEDTGEESPRPPKKNPQGPGRRSRITKFPGKK